MWLYSSVNEAFDCLSLLPHTINDFSKCTLLPFVSAPPPPPPFPNFNFINLIHQILTLNIHYYLTSLTQGIALIKNKFHQQHLHLHFVHHSNNKINFDLASSKSKEDKSSNTNHRGNINHKKHTTKKKKIVEILNIFLI